MYFLVKKNHYNLNELYIIDCLFYKNYSTNKLEVFNK